MRYKKRKYKNEKVERKIGSNVYSFDSKAEAKEFDILYNQLKAKVISELKLQPEFQLTTAFLVKTNTTKNGNSKVGIMKYTPDFSYIQDGKKIVIEVKGMKTTSYTIRKKLFLSIAYERYGVNTFIEIINKKRNIYHCDTVKEVTSKKK